MPDNILIRYFEIRVDKGWFTVDQFYRSQAHGRSWTNLAGGSRRPRHPASVGWRSHHAHGDAQQGSIDIALLGTSDQTEATRSFSSLQWRRRMQILIALFFLHLAQNMTGLTPMSSASNEEWNGKKDSSKEASSTAAAIAGRLCRWLGFRGSVA